MLFVVLSLDTIFFKNHSGRTGGFKAICYGLFLILLFLPSCIRRKSDKINPISCDSNLCIEMPDNKLVFENISSLVYDSVWNHFDRVGYKLDDKKSSDYSLKIIVQDVGSSYKFLSPDLLTYSVKMRMELLCELVDINNKTLAKKLFSFHTLVSKAKDYVENSKFLDFEFSQLLERQVYKIEKYFRKYIGSA